jgi:hypothetical protein
VIHGRLLYTPASGIEVELVESPVGAGQLLQGNVPEIGTLFGQLVDGTLVTLLDCHIGTAAVQIGVGIGSSTKIIANTAVFGRHVADLDQLPIKTMALELSSLSNWTGSTPMRLNLVEQEGRGAGFDVTIRRPPPIQVPLVQHDFDIEIAHSLSLQPSYTGFTSHWAAEIDVTAKQSLPFQKMRELTWQTQNLISLLVGERLSVRAATLIPADQQPPPPILREQIAIRAFSLYSARDPAAASADDNWYEAERQLRQARAITIRPPLKLIFQQVGKHDQPEVHPALMLLPYPVIRDVFSTMVERWFSRSEQAVLATNVFFGSQDFKSPAVNVKFLSVAQAAESYHRSLGTGVYMDQAAFDAAMQQFTTHMPAVIQGDHRHSLINRLRYGNEHSMRRRLAAMFERIPESAALRIAGHVTRFINKFVDTRNYFTHYDHASRANAFGGKDAYNAAERMRILVVANLLHDLGIHHSDLLRVLEGHQEFRHWMNEPLPL